MNTLIAAEDALLEHSRIQRISLAAPPQWAIDQMEYVSHICEIQELADMEGWEADDILRTL